MGRAHGLFVSIAYFSLGVDGAYGQWTVLVHRDTRLFSILSSKHDIRISMKTPFLPLYIRIGTSTWYQELTAYQDEAKSTYPIKEL